MCGLVKTACFCHRLPPLLASRCVALWAVDSAKDDGVAGERCVVMPIFRLGRTLALLHHCDQGSQFTSEDFQRWLERHRIVRNMSPLGIG